MTDPTMALVVLLTFAVLRPFFEVPDAQEKRRALKAGGYKPSVKMGCAYLLMVPVLLGGWWWYALATDQILLGVIPTVGSMITAVMQAVERSGQR